MAVACQVHVRQGKDETKLSGRSGDVPTVVRLQWAKCIADGVTLGLYASQSSLQPLDFLLHTNGHVERRRESEPVHYDEHDDQHQYPAHFRIPPDTLDGLPLTERIVRAERFAVGSLIFEVMSTGKPHVDLSNAEVQDRFKKGVYPENVIHLPHGTGVSVLGLWSVEFANELGIMKMLRGWRTLLLTLS